MRRLKKADPEVWWAVRGEMNRQQEHLELIASENYASPTVLAAQGSALTNKYAEGLPERRYYGGCEWVDQAEQLAIDRLKQLFGADHANVQPHSGSQANMAVYFAAIRPKDTILCMNLSHGGHLTHGSKVNFSGKLFHVVSYGVDRETERLDYAAIRELAGQHNPDMIVAGASAYPRTIDFDTFAEIADELDVPLMVDMAHIAGLVATGLHPNPVPVSAFVTSTTHKTLRGPRGGFVLCRQEYARKLDSNVFPGIQGGPLMHIIAAKAVAFGEALRPEFVEYQKQVLANAKAMGERLLAGGLRLVTGGTDNHLLLVDLSVKGLTGSKAEAALQNAGITVNKNLIPFDTRKPQETSGVRLGSPALTTRGMKEDEMRTVADLILRVLADPDNESLQHEVRAEVKELCRQFPVPMPEWAEA